MTTSWKKLAALLPVALTASALHAGTASVSDGKATDDVVAPKEQSIYDKIWGLATIYKNDENPFIEELDFTGRLQIDYFNVSSNKGHNDYFELRRFRFGEDAFFAERHVEIKAELDTNLRQFNTPETFYNRFTDLFVNFHVSDALNLKVGKQQARFGYDRSYSDTQLLTFERSALDDLVYTSQDYHSAATIFGKSGNWFYQAAVVSLDVNKEFGEFNGGEAYLANLTYDFGSALGAKKAAWSVDYFHSDPNKNADVFKNYRNGVVTYFDYQQEKYGLVAQVGWLDGLTNAITNGDVYEGLLQANYNFTEKLQLVARYQLEGAENDNGIAITNRQEKTVGAFTGDSLNSGYVGLNYYIYGHKLKLMAGEQYSDLTGGTGAKAGYSGWTTLVGLRMYW